MFENCKTHVANSVISNALYMPFKLQAVHSKYAGMAARVGPDQEVMFQDRKITLDIPEEGVTLTTGWMITPLTHPGVRLH